MLPAEDTTTNERKRILFVDDEPHLLAGLRRALRSCRGDWDMVFAGSGSEALELAERDPFDAVVSDMRMPGMDGAELLGEIARRHPGTVRIILSGYSDEASIMRLVDKAHQFLAKPCDPERLQSVLIRSFALQKLLSNEKLQAIVSSLNSLPSLPLVYQKLRRLLHSEDATVREVGALIGEDPPMTAKLLQVVNSAFFSVGRRITNPEEAASLVGMDVLKGLALVNGIFRQFESNDSNPQVAWLERLWRHSLRVGYIAREVAKAEHAAPSTIDDAMTAGLLHDIGVLLFAFQMPEAWDRVQALVQSEGMPHWEAEARIAGVPHNLLGAYLLGLWGLPQAVVEAVACNRHPGSTPVMEFTPLTAVHVANAMVNGEERLDRDYIAALGLEDRLESWRAMAEAATSDVAS
jgi:HD-like signal output (HDOD) protein